MENPIGPLLIQDDFDDAPDDDAGAFLFLEEAARRRLYLTVEEDQNGYKHYPLKNEYMTRVAGLAQTFNVPGITFDEDYRDVDNEFSTFISRVDYQTTQINATLSRARRRHSLRFDGATKQKISFHLERVREVISTADISERRKAALQKRLDDLEAELAKPRSSLTPILLGAVVILGISADVSEISTTLKSAASAILEAVGQMRLEADEREVEMLPSPPLQIAPPVNIKRREATEGPYGDLDDDIPF